MVFAHGFFLVLRIKAANVEKTNKFSKQKIAVEDMIPSNSKAQLVFQNYCSHLFNLHRLYKKIEYSNYFTSLIQ